MASMAAISMGPQLGPDASVIAEEPLELFKSIGGGQNARAGVGKSTHIRQAAARHATKWYASTKSGMARFLDQ